MAHLGLLLILAVNFWVLNHSSYPLILVSKLVLLTRGFRIPFGVSTILPQFPTLFLWDPRWTRPLAVEVALRFHSRVFSHREVAAVKTSSTETWESSIVCDKDPLMEPISTFLHYVNKLKKSMPVYSILKNLVALWFNIRHWFIKGLVFG